MTYKPNTLNNCLRCQSAQVTALATQVVCHSASKYLAVHTIVHDIYKTVQGEGEGNAHAHTVVEANRIEALSRALKICDVVWVAMTAVGREGGA